jgi:hypothetical protein
VAGRIFAECAKCATVGGRESFPGFSPQCHLGRADLKLPGFKDPAGEIPTPPSEYTPLRAALSFEAPLWWWHPEKPADAADRTYCAQWRRCMDGTKLLGVMRDTDSSLLRCQNCRAPVPCGPRAEPTMRLACIHQPQTGPPRHWEGRRRAGPRAGPMKPFSPTAKSSRNRRDLQCSLIKKRGSIMLALILNAIYRHFLKAALPGMASVGARR